jgi:O-antigen ligase
MGIVGLIAVLMLPLAAVRRALKTVRPGQLQAAPLAGAVGILGVLVASATNPYLLSGFGMLAITIALSLTDSGSSRTSPSKPKAVATA